MKKQEDQKFQRIWPKTKIGSHLIMFLKILIALCWAFVDILTVVFNRFRQMICILIILRSKSCKRNYIKRGEKLILMRLVQFISKTVAKLKTKAVFHWTLILVISVKWVFVDMSMSMDIVFISSKQNNFRYSRCIYNRQIKLREKIKRLNLKDENTCWEKITARLARGGKLEGDRLGTIRMMFSFHLTSSIFFALFCAKESNRVCCFYFSLLLYFKWWPGIIRVVNKIRLFAMG